MCGLTRAKIFARLPRSVLLPLARLRRKRLLRRLGFERRANQLGPCKSRNIFKHSCRETVQTTAKIDANLETQHVSEHVMQTLSDVTKNKGAFS